MQVNSRVLHKILLIVGIALLSSWGYVWAKSVKKNHLLKNWSYIPNMPVLGCDFDINYYATRTWLAGGDPYRAYVRKGIGPIEAYTAKYDHPPLVLLLFSWSSFLPHRLALATWLIVQTAVLVLAVCFCSRNRYELGLVHVPLPLLLAVTLFSYPVLAEMERGNWNTLPLFFALVTVWALRARSLGRDFFAGTCAAIAAWIKCYPGLLLLGLIALRRWRAVGFFGIVMLLIALSNVSMALEFADNIKETAKLTPDFVGYFVFWSHTISGSWQLFCNDIHLKWLSNLPGYVGWMLLVLPMIIWVSYRVSTSPNHTQLLYPYFLWLIASATYLPAVANDYNLIFLPLAAFAVWDRRDNLFIHGLMALMLIWCQPLWLPGSAKFLWYAKLVSLGTIAILLATRAKNYNSADTGKSESFLRTSNFGKAIRAA